MHNLATVSSGLLLISLLTGCSSDRQALFTVSLHTIERVSALEPREIVKRGRLAPLNVRSIKSQSPGINKLKE